MKLIKTNKLALLFIIILSTSLYVGLKEKEFGYVKPAHISQEVWDQVSPYFLPLDHPVKPILDKAFSTHRVLHSKKEVALAGFTLLQDKSYDLMVARPEKAREYLIKFYFDYHDIKRLDTEGDWPLWLLRIQGLKRVEEVVEKYQYQDIVKTPKKWIYPLPGKPAPIPYGPNKENFRKSFVLVTEDMRIVPDDMNEKLYKEMGPRQVEALYHILKEAHLYDSVYIDNNPFSYDGKLTFIDTEEFDRKPVRYRKITRYFSPSMQKHWQNLYREDKNTTETVND